MIASVDFLMSMPEAAIEQVDINKDVGMYSVFSIRNIKEHSTALSIVSRLKLVINSCLQGV